jgi:carboxypeptidase-like protein/TonB-dependent receptor-like protein
LIRAALSAMTLAILLTTGAWAQLSTGKIEGTVRDSDTGQPLSGTQVVIEGTRLGNVTNQDGYFFILNVSPGRRNIVFTYTGYQKTTITNQMILAGQTITVDANLSSTVVELEGITVESEGDVLVPRDNTVTKQRLTAERMAEIPATTLEDMLVLEAGVQIGGADARGRGLKIRGGRLGEEGMVVDGIMVRNYTANVESGGGGWRFDFEEGTQSEDATPVEFSSASIEQVDIITGGFQAEYGNAQSGIVNIVTKEGGPLWRGFSRMTTDGMMPRTSDWGYNQLTASVGGPIPLVPDLYINVSGEAQGQEDRSRTHADEGFRGIDQTFVNRLNYAMRNDPYFEGRSPYSLEGIQAGQAAYGEKTGGSQSLFSAPNPVRLQGNWQDRTMTASKITYSPIRTLKVILTDNWSRNQHSYPTGNTGSADGNYFRDGRIDRYDPLYESLFESRNWQPGEESVYIPQSYARSSRANTFLGGFNFDFLSTATNKGSVQFRYSKVHSLEINNALPKTNWERDSWLGWSPHNVQFEIESYPNRDGLPTVELQRQYLPDGATTWKKNVPIAYPFELNRETLYMTYYRYLRERQDNFKVDFDFQLGRYNRTKIGGQFTTMDNFRFTSSGGSSIRDPRNTFMYDPEVYSLYVQNRTDLGDFIIDYGIRFDGFEPNENWGSTALDIVGEHVFPKTLTEWSPRFDVAFPVTDRSQVRFSYGAFTQLPSMSFIYAGSSGGSGIRNRGDLGFARTDAFEAGVSQVLTDNIVFDLVAYYRDIYGNVSSKPYFVDYWASFREQRIRTYVDGYSNKDNGNIKGVELSLRKRFSNNFALNTSYTLQFSRTTGSSVYSGFYDRIDPSTGESFQEPSELNPISGDRAHQISAQLNYFFPTDYMEGTLTGALLKNIKIYAGFTMQSGAPTGDSDASIGGLVYGTNYFRGRWYTDLNLRFTKGFSFGGARRLDVFAEIFNTLNRKNSISYPAGYQYESYDNVTGGVDIPWSDDLDVFNKARFAADFNADGVLTVEESALGAIANSFIEDTMNKRDWGTARQVRAGIGLNF